MKAHVAINDDGVHSVEIMDVIEHERGLWLVPDWLDSPDRTVTTPTRIVSLETLPHKRIRDHVTVDDPVPRFVFDGQIPPELAATYIVREPSNVFVPLGPQ